MTFQTVFDNAETLSINKLKKVAQTVSRDGVVKATSLGGQAWEFEVSLPDGNTWTTYRPLIEKMEALDRVSTDSVNLNKTSLRWISEYQGNYSSITSITASYAGSGNTITLTGGPSITSGFKFKSGDLIQLGTSGKVYSVVNDVAFSSNTVTLHRPVREAAGNFTLLIGPNVSWTVICTQFPKWTLIERNRVGWSGPFVFSEAL
jgi:hypothetical protein